MTIRWKLHFILLLLSTFPSVTPMALQRQRLRLPDRRAGSLYHPVMCRRDGRSEYCWVCPGTS